MLMNPYALVFLIFCLGFAAYGSITAQPTSIGNWEVSAFILGIASITFFLEATKTEHLLTDIFLNKPRPR